jgi:hypothetical protein
LKPLIPVAKHGRRPRKVDIREIFDAVFPINWSGCQWDMLPHDLPPKSGVFVDERYTGSSAAMIQMNSIGMMLCPLHVSPSAAKLNHQNVAWTREKPGESLRIDSESGRNGIHPLARPARPEWLAICNMREGRLTTGPTRA